MKNINKSNIMGLIGMDVINIKNEEVGTVVGDFNGKYIVNVDGEEKFYSESTLIRNWKIVEEETEETSNEEIITEEVKDEDEIIDETEEVTNEENIEDENKLNEVVEEETEETSNEEIIAEEIKDEDEIIDETEEVTNEENIEDENKPNEVVEEETEETSNEEIITEEINDEDEIVDETEDVISETEETEEFVLETENEGIIDNIKETEGRVKITGHLYGIPVKFDKINQTTVWKTLIKLYDNRKDENDKYSLDDKKYLVRQLKQLDEKVFAGAFRCLVSKTKQNYIEELMK